jgi:hypothetical protein
MFYGMWGSKAEELGWWANWHPELSKETILKTIAKRDFGNLGLEVIEAWDLISQAIGHLPCIPPYFTGPWFLGPAHPLILKKNNQISSVFKGALYYKQENEESLSKARLTILDSLILTELPHSPRGLGFQSKNISGQWEDFLFELEQVSTLCYKAFEKLQSIILQQFKSKINEIQLKNFEEERLLIEFFYRTNLCVYNSIQFLWIRDNTSENYAKLHEIAETELKNANDSFKIYEKAPWLNLDQRVDGKFPSSLAMLEEKIRILEQFLENKN